MMTTSAGRVAGKTVLISGGARGQGASHGRLLAQHGAGVVLGDLLDSDGEATAARLRAEGLPVRYVHLDVALPEDWDRAIAVAESEFGHLDVVVNNAGIGGPGTVEDCSLDEWQRVIAVNQTGVFLGINRSIPALRRAGGGSIINISSVFGVRGSQYGIAYHATKGAVHLITRAAAVSLAPEIRVNTIIPGLVATELMRATVDAETLAARLRTYPMNRAATPADISAAVLFFASDESAYVTGAELAVDGGALAGVRNR